MSTWRDLAEAQSFLRARLLAAYLSGNADGPKVTPPGTGRPLAVGLLLAVAGAGVEVARRLL